MFDGLVEIGLALSAVLIFVAGILFDRWLYRRSA